MFCGFCRGWQGWLSLTKYSALRRFYDKVSVFIVFCYFFYVFQYSPVISKVFSPLLVQFQHFNGKKSHDVALTTKETLCRIHVEIGKIGKIRKT